MQYAAQWSCPIFDLKLSENNNLWFSSSLQDSMWNLSEDLWELWQYFQYTVTEVC